MVYTLFLIYKVIGLSLTNVTWCGIWICFNTKKQLFQDTTMDKLSTVMEETYINGKKRMRSRSKWAQSSWTTSRGLEWKLEIEMVEQETKVENISQGTVKQELEIKIETEEKVDSTMMVKQEGLWAFDISSSIRFSHLVNHVT